MLNSKQNKISPASSSDSKKFVLNLSKHVLSDSEDTVLRKGLNFAVAKPHSNTDMACAAESVVLNLPGTLGMEFRWMIRSMLEKSKPASPNITKQEFRALKSLKLNKDIRILQADKGNCTVMLDESEYRNKLNLLLDSGIYKPLSEDPTGTVERKVQKPLSKHKAACLLI
jgi:hypothetical protein